MNKPLYIIETNKETGKQYLWATSMKDRAATEEGMNIVYPINQFPRTRGTFEVVNEIPTPCWLAGNGKQIR